jgi:hypothetical protein
VTKDIAGSGGSCQADGPNAFKVHNCTSTEFLVSCQYDMIMGHGNVKVHRVPPN